MHEASPYLQQHAHNPVDWYPWGDEALQKAKAEDKPILLSVGYSACHWCHVMEHESFDSPAIAGLMNDHFVSIKVDREERPDIDHIYQSICQLVTRQGGWPLTVFLTPELKPFYVGTYFPPEDRYGRPGFPKVLRSLADLWANKRGELGRVADQWSGALREMDLVDPAAAGLPERALVARAAGELADRVDREHGGFGGAPKFPNPTGLELMLRQAAAGGGQPLLSLVTLTLHRMAHGGIYDQLGGGFHRYSVDARWAVPHFEKMLYDNALLVPVYTAAWQLTGEPLFRRVVQETLAYVQREMTHPDGGLYSTQDADSEGEEGKFFVWTPAEVQEVLGEEEGTLLCRHLGVDEQGNFEHGTTVLHVSATAAQLAAELGVPAAGVEKRLAAGRARLFAAREQRIKPFRDEKILTGWNGLMISAFARAALAFGEPSYAAAARCAADFILDRLMDERGRLLRRFKSGRPGQDGPDAGAAQVGITGYLEDYAYLTAGLIDLYEATFDERYLTTALRLAGDTLEQFWDGEAAGYFIAPAGAPDLIHRPKEAFDSATPAGASVAIMNQLRLYPFAGRADFRETAEAVFRAYRMHMERMPSGLASLVSALDLYLAGATEVTIVAEPDDALAAEWRGRLGGRYLPNLVLTRVTAARAAEAGESVPIWAGKAARDGQAAAYVCRHFTCSPPAATWAELERYLEA